MAGSYRRCGCINRATGKRFGTRCPRLSDSEHGSWYFAVQATDTDRRGRRIRLRRGGYASPEAAVNARATTGAREDSGPFGDVTTVRDWLYTWLAMISGKVRETLGHTSYAFTTTIVSRRHRVWHRRQTFFARRVAARPPATTTSRRHLARRPWRSKPALAAASIIELNHHTRDQLEDGRGQRFKPNIAPPVRAGRQPSEGVPSEGFVDG